MTSNEIPLMSIGQLGQFIKAKEVSPLEVTRSTLDRIERLNPVLNCFITVTSEAATERAIELTSMLANGRWLGPLHGIPVSLKDNIATASIRTTAGTPILADWVPEVDSYAWERLKEAGAVLVGKNNLWEFAFGNVHPEYGRALNPWDLTRTCGGTSSGSASAVAAGLSFASLGTDTGGSARVPCSLCGLVGLKPTFDPQARVGVLPVSYTMDHVCPMTRDVTDCALVFDALAGRRDHGGTSTQSSHVAEIEAGVSGLTIAVAKLNHDEPIDPEVRAALEHAVSVLEREGALIEEVVLPDFDQAGTAARVIMDSEAADYHRPYLRTQASQYDQVALTRLQTAEFIPATQYVRAQRVRQKMINEIETVLAKADAIVLPALAVAAYGMDKTSFNFNGREVLPLKVLSRYSPLFNLTGHPALVLPCGMNSEGFPLSMQIVGRFFDEKTIFRVARAYERVTDWVRVPVEV